MDHRRNRTQTGVMRLRAGAGAGARPFDHGCLRPDVGSTIYAAGDVTSRIQLAHLASAQAINAVDTMLGRTPQFDLNCVPSCLYTHPEAAWVGLSEEEAQAQGLSVIVGKTTTLSNSKSMIEQAPRGFVKLIADAVTRRLVGGGLPERMPATGSAQWLRPSASI